MKPHLQARHLAVPALIFGITLATAADDPASEAFFETRIRPVLVESCYECHSVENGKAKGGLTLDSREASRLGGDNGPAIVPGKPEESLLLTAIFHEDPDMEMPPKGPALSDRVRADFLDWITAGAIDPREAPSSGTRLSEYDMEARKEFWSYQKPTRRAAPQVEQSDWPKSPIDSYVLAQLEAASMEPSPDADPRILLRRLHFDLTGLPPTPEEAATFRMENLEETVDRLLASDDFGVRWGRHWLDVVRFAESNGRESNIAYPHAWRYRDYVIDAFNADIPFDRFLTEQIAGDLLPADSDAERSRLLIATGFLALGAKGLNEMNPKQFAADLVDEQVDTVTRAFIANSVACARCHDHKDDPFTMQDYYAMAGIFRSTETFYGTWIDSENNNDSDLITLPELPDQLIPNKPIAPERLAKLKEDLAQLDRDEAEGKAMRAKAQAEGKDMREDFNEILREALRIYWTRGRLEGQLETVDDEGNPLPLCMGAMEAEEAVDARRFERGEVAHPAEEIPRGMPDIFETDLEIPEEVSGRLELAQWLTLPDHPLTARVMANRIWTHLFGNGLVRTVDNFGHTGEAPTHPELLDHLALELQENDWSVKALIRNIVLSRAYLQSSQYRADYFEQDPENKLLWRANQRRRDAESIRDSILAVSGTLDPSRRPGSLVADLNGQSISIIGFNKKVPDDLDGTHYRSAYLPVLRDNLPDVLDLFDFAEPSLVTGKREETNVPLQALYLMNSSFIQEQSQALASRLESERPTRDARVQRAFELCYNRPPLPEEAQLVSEYFTEASPETESRELALFCQALLASAEFRIVE